MTKSYIPLSDDGDRVFYNVATTDQTRRVW